MQLDHPGPAEQASDTWLDECGKRLESLRRGSELAGFITRKRRELAGMPCPSDGLGLMPKYSGLMDLSIARLFRLAVEEALDDGEAEATAASSQVAVASTGGYGRLELCPFSDIDVVFIVNNETTPAEDAVVRRMFRLIMDVLLTGAKLKVGYSYRQPDQCLGLPQETQTSLLDARRITGGEDIFAGFATALRQSIDPLAFLRRNRSQRRQVRRKFGESPHRVEPNVKESAGGLRDLQASRWAAQVAFGVAGENAWDELLSRGGLDAQDVAQLREALWFISCARHYLHLSSGRANDVLTVERREAVAAGMQFLDEEHPIDELMRRYYRHAENVDYLTEKALAFCDQQRFEIDKGVYAANGSVYFLPSEGETSLCLAQTPGLMARAVRYTQRYNLTLSQGAMDAMRRATASTDTQADEESNRVFLELLSSSSVSETLTGVARLGLLQWLLPEFGDLLSLLPGDVAHEHTVGEHSLQVARNLDSLRRDEDEEIREIFAEVRDKRLLFLAGLLHDVGKLHSNGNHAEAGTATAENAARRLGLPEHDAAKVAFLVRNHLLMGDTARLRDLNETRTVSEFVGIVDDIDKLRMLFLLTLADFRAVGDSNWSAVHVRFLRELFHRASRLLSSPPSQDYELDIERHRRRVRRELSLVNLPPAEVDEHSRSMPVAYLLNTSPEDMAAHIEYVRQVRAGTPVVDLRDDATSDFTRLTVCAMDDPRPGLLAKIAGVLYVLDVDIHAAEVFTRESEDQIAIDTLYVDFEQCQLPDFKKRQVTADMTNILANKLSVTELLQQRNKPSDVALQVHDLAIMSHLSDRYTVLEVVASDCEGLLFHITKAISSLLWNIHGARVTTFAGHARDAFYVTDTLGNKLSQGSEQMLLKKLTSLD